MTVDQQKEQLSAAYLLAVASAAGCACKDVKVDNDSVDVSVVSTMKGTKFHSPQLDIQLKATSRDLLNDTDIVFPLGLKNYEDLRKKTIVPRILVVMLVPEEPSAWLSQTEEVTEVYNCAYWVSLWGHPDTTNSTSVTIKIPRQNVLTPSALSTLMTTIADGGRP